MNHSMFAVLVRSIISVLMLFPVCAVAGQASIPGFYGSSAIKPPAPAQLPQLKQPNVSIPGISGIEQNPSKNHLIIRQNQPKAIIDWSSFDIGADAWTQFDQQGNTTWTALNRIWENKPSLIYGKLTADGKIYLINQNGILFGPGSKVNVHGLVASALNISDEKFLKDIFKNKNRVLIFERTEGADGLATVSNHGEIVAAGGGSLFLLGPRVENAGVMEAAGGQIGLASGTKVTLAQPDADDLSRSGYYVLISDDFGNPPNDNASFGNAINRREGRLHADGGIVGMYGNVVEQWGIIRSTTAFKNKKGIVELRAATKVLTGEESSISLPVDASIDPETGKLATVSDTFDIQSEVHLRGLHTWSSTDTIIDLSPVGKIEHRGDIVAPAGNVVFHARDRVFLDAGSLIDVSGVVAELPASFISDFKLNTVELRDAYGQKGGVLQGEKITTTLTEGSTIGDLSQLILTQDRSAIERSIGGATRTRVDEKTGIVTYYNPQIGQISLAAADGDIIVKGGAVLDFSGGEIHYLDGFADTTKLLSGTKIYDISSAPLSVRYDKIMTRHRRTFEKFGVREEYAGLYYGGGSPLKTHIRSSTKGGDAGRLSLSASTIVLDGTLRGSVTKGDYQNAWTMRGSFTGENAGSDYDLAIALSERRGLETPRAGILEIGPFDRNEVTNYATTISILPDREPRTALTVDLPREKGTTFLSAEILNEAGLGTLNLTANLTISTAETASIRLEPGGVFTADARRIEHQGAIVVPGGAIRLIAGQNLTTEKDAAGYDNPPDNYISLEEKIVLGKKSRLDASGERVDRRVSWGGGNPQGFSHASGGIITIRDQTDRGKGVFIPQGAVIDVSGGYVINADGKVAGGHAGLLEIQGSQILLDGDLRGFALSDEKGAILGGSITLQSLNIRVAPKVSTIKDTFVLSGDRFIDTGFSQIKLYSYGDIVIDSKTVIAPSLLRLNSPVSAVLTGITGGQRSSSGAGSSSRNLIRLDDGSAFMAGPSSFTAIAGKEFEGSVPGFTGYLRPVDVNTTARVIVSGGATVKTAPAATAVTRIANDVSVNPLPVQMGIILKGPSIDVRGTLESLGGSISLDATHDSIKTNQDTRLIVHGYNRPDPYSTPKGFPVNFLPVAGGSVHLSSYKDLALSAKSLIDISGSDEVTVRMRSTDGALLTYSDASDPGSLSLSFGGNLTWSATVKVQGPISRHNQTRGGSLSIARLDTGQEEKALTIAAADIRRFTSIGFDDITLKSPSTVRFTGTIDTDAGSLGRKLTIDAPEIGGAGNSFSLRAPWIVLTNRTQPGLVSGRASKGSLAISGEWIDVIGSVQFSGFRDVTLSAGKDIRLSEAMYDDNIRGGRLSATDNLTLDADRIYPSSFYSYKQGRTSVSTGIYSDFTIHAGGKITVLHSSEETATNPIYSACGSLSVEAGEGIEVKRGGYLAAPMGTVALSAPGQRILLANGSVITTAGNPATAITYGIIDESNLWITDDKVSIQNAVLFTKERLSRKGITMDADTEIVMDGAVLDVSGGGKVFAFKFLPGIEGSYDPLAKPGRYLVFKDNSFPMPGAGIYLKGGGGLSEGFYTILPLDTRRIEHARYAFLPGAYILEDHKGSLIPSSTQPSYSKFGYPITIGYPAVADTDIIGTRPRVFTVRTAADVLSEGHFVLPQPIVAGDGGDILFRGNSAIINGTIRASALSRHRGGTLDLKARNIAVHASPVPLSAGFEFASSIPDKQKGLLNLNMAGISDQGFHTMKIGDPAVTETITIGGKTILHAPVIECSARQMIAVEAGAEIHGSSESGKGTVNLNAPSGSAVIEQGALLHASHAFNLNVGRPDIEGDLKVENSAVTLKATEIAFVQDKERYLGNGLAITDTLWSKFGSCEDISLVSGSDIAFFGDFDLSAVGTLSMDASRIVGIKEDGATVSLSAPSINLGNSGNPSSATHGEKTGAITFTSETASIGEGSVLFSGFAEIHFKSTKEFILKGAGSLVTGDADLRITTAQVKTSHVPISVQGSGGIPTAPVRAPQFFVDAGSGSVVIIPNGTMADNDHSAGGMLEIAGRKIDVSSVIHIDAGTIKLTTKGFQDRDDDGIFLRNGAQIIAKGTDHVPGGRVILSTDYLDETGSLKSGSITLEEGSVIDVSAGAQGDAGAISLSAPVKGVTMDGTLRGASRDGGSGGSLTLDTNEISDLDTLYAKLATQSDDEGNLISGGFSGDIHLRARTGALDIPADLTIAAHRIRLEADDHSNGTITVSGSLEARGSHGGKIELYAYNDITVGETGRILAIGDSDSLSSGIVELSSAHGWVDLKPGGTIDLSSHGGGRGGTLTIRAERENQDVKIRLRGTITGATVVYVEAVKTYANDTPEDFVFEMWDTVLPATRSISSLSVGEGSTVSFSYNERFYTATLEPKEYASGEDLAAALETALNSASYTDYENDEASVPLPSALFKVDYGITVPDRLSVRNISPDGTDVFAFTVPSQFGFAVGDVIRGVASEYVSDADAYVKSGVALSRLKAEAPAIAPVLHLLPGIEIVNRGGGITVGNVHLVGTRFGETGAREPGVLTLRAAGTLTIGNSLTDNPTLREVLLSSGKRDSWAYMLVAGSDTDAAHPMAVNKGRGDLVVANQTLVYTESAPIRFAAGNDAVIGSGRSAAYMVNRDMIYSLASYDGEIRGSVERDLIINGGAIQTATGDIDLIVGRDVQLNIVRDRLTYLGSIRTTGQTTVTLTTDSGAGVPDLTRYWTYGSGGDITIDAGRHLGSFQQGRWVTALDGGAWDMFTKQTVTLPLQEGQTRPTEISYGLFSASYETSFGTSTTATAGLATMGGGNLAVRTAGDFLTQSGTFGTGDLTIYAGGDIRGRFLTRKGTGEIHAGGNIGSAAERQQIEIFDSRVYMTAAGEIQIAAVLNPTLASNKIVSYRNNFVDCSYSADSGITIKAGTDVTLSGRSPFYTGRDDTIEDSILPPMVSIAAGGNIWLSHYFTLTSSPTGNLRLVAGRDIRGVEPLTGEDRYRTIMMSDIAPEYWYGLFQTYGTAEAGRTWVADRTVTDTVVSNKHGYYKDAERQAATKPLHAVLVEDADEVKAIKTTPIEIRAGGSIKNLKLYLPKKAEITARGQIENLIYEGQNTNPSDLTKIQAGGDISMAYVRSDEAAAIDRGVIEGMIQGGPGVFLVQAGGSIDLGTLRDGIQMIGNGRYAQLGSGKGTLIILSGYTFEPEKPHDDISAFFTAIRKAGDDYAQLLADGKVDEGSELLHRIRQQTILPFLGTPSGDGDINMTSSQIGTSIGQSDIFIIAAGDMNLGQTALPVSGKVNKKTGITTGGGGAINIFAGRDVNVNESRIMTFLGGDITIWSDAGNINAGRGSRTAVSASPPKVMDDGTKIFSPPAIGSGIRAVTYGENPPPPGDIHLFAPSGIIDAGEAEIVGGKIILAAVEVLNVQNIIFSAGSIGVPQPSTGASGIGSISGSGALTQASQLTSEASGLAAARAAEAAKAIEEIMAKWLDVKIIDFVLEEKDKEDEGKR